MIVTFYSFKGGVGRSMAVANVAELLADAGYDVVVCDWDLEAPGLERYLFETREEAEECRRRRGVMDLLLEYKDSLLENPEGENMQVEGVPFHEQLRKPIDVAFQAGGHRRRYGSLRLITAGERAGSVEEAYVRNVQSFNWSDFYERWAGAAYMEFFRENLENNSDVVLIDSRTGITEHGGVCTHHLADIVVLMTAANDLNVDGTCWLAENLVRPELAALRGGRPIRLLPVASRIEQTSQKDELSRFRARFQASFARFLPKEIDNAGDFWAESEIPYIPFYAFSERVVARESRAERHRELYKSYMTVAQAIARIGIEACGLNPPPRGGWLRASLSRGLTEGTDLTAILVGHGEWLESGGARGARAILRERDLSRHKLDEVNLRRADLHRAVLKGADLWQANLQEANLSRALLSGANLRGACLDGTNLEDADLERADLEGATLRGARLVRASLRQAVLSDCDLEGADLRNANLDNADLRGALLSRVSGLSERQMKNALSDSRTRLPQGYEPELSDPKRGESGSGDFKYDAFISYSREGDRKLVNAVEAAISSYAKPWYKTRILRIFRDEKIASFSPSLWELLSGSLDAANFLLLVASPDSARSKQVIREVEYWIEYKGVDNLLILLIDGQLVWDEKVGDFDWSQTTALPNSFRYKFAREPYFVDLRWATGEQHLSLRHPDFQEAVATISSVIRKVPKEQLISEQILQLKRKEMIRTSGVLVLSILAGAVLSNLGEGDKVLSILKPLLDLFSQR